MSADLLLQGGLIVDGSGADPFPGDVLVEGDRIAAVIAAEGPAQDSTPETREVIDARDRVVSPGFIDIHSYADWVLPQADHGAVLRPLLEQGVTTLVTGNCGFSPAPVNPELLASFKEWSDMLRDRELSWDWSSVESFFDYLEREDLLFNVAHLAGHGSLRLSTMGRADGQPSGAEQAAMRDEVREALDEGAFGLSTGLGYAPGMFAGVPELADLASVVAEEGGLLTSHLRAYTWISPFYGVNPFRWVDHNLRAVRDVLAVAERSGARLQISHLTFVGLRTWRTCEKVIREIEDARERGVDVAFDCFPYTGGNTTIGVIYPPWVQVDLVGKLQRAEVRARLRAELALLRRVIGIGFEDVRLLWAANDDYACYEGMTFDRIARDLGVSPYDAYFRLTVASDARARVMIHAYSGDEGNEAPLRRVMAHPLNSFGTDTILVSRGHHNPASFGTFPRLLGRYVREEKLMGLADAVFKMSGAPADRLGVRDRGRVQEGYRADLVVFDPETIGCDASFSKPDLPPTGIEQVLLNGRVVVAGGRWNGRSAGHVLRRGR